MVCGQLVVPLGLVNKQIGRGAVQVNAKNFYLIVCELLEPAADNGLRCVVVKTNAATGKWKVEIV